MGEGNGKRERPVLRLLQGGLPDRPVDRKRSEGRPGEDRQRSSEPHGASRAGSSGEPSQAPHFGEAIPNEATSLRRGWVYVEYSNFGMSDVAPHFVSEPTVAAQDPRDEPMDVLEPTEEVFDPTLRSIVSIVHEDCTVPMGVVCSNGQQYAALHKERVAMAAKPSHAVRGKMHPRDERRLSLGVVALDLIPEAISGGVLQHLEYIHQRHAHASQEHMLSTAQGLEDKQWLGIPRFRATFGALIDSLFNGQYTHGELHVPLYNNADAVSTMVGSLALLELLYGERPVLVARSEDSNGMEQLETQAAQLGGVLVRLRLDAQRDHAIAQPTPPASAIGQWLVERLSVRGGISSLLEGLRDLPGDYQKGSLVERLDALYNRHVTMEETIHNIAEQYRQHRFEQEQRALIEKIQSQYALYTKLLNALQTLERHHNAFYRRLLKDRRVCAIPAVPDLHTMEYEPSLSGLHGHLQTLTRATQKMLEQISDQDDMLLRTKYHIDLPLQ